MDQIAEKIEELNSLLGGAMPFKLGYFDPNKLTLLETNARYMPNDKFAALVNNMKRDKGVASVPLVYAAEDPGAPLVLSGNHRTQAAIKAGIERLLCLVITDPKTPEELVAIQLSHNAIAGADDLQTLKQLYESVQALDMKSYSGLDEDTIQKLGAIKFEPISEPRLFFKAVNFLFLPTEAEELQNALKRADKLLKDEETYLFQIRDYQEFFDLVVKAKEGLSIKNSAVAILELMRAGMRQVEAERAQRDAEEAKRDAEKNKVEIVDEPQPDPAPAPAEEKPDA